MTCFRHHSLRPSEQASAWMGIYMASIADRNPRYRNFVWEVRRYMEPQRNAHRLQEWQTKRRALVRLDLSS